MPIHPNDTALQAALRLDFAGSRWRDPRDDIGNTVLACLAASPEPLTACVAVFDVTDIPAGIYCVDSAGFLHRAHSQAPPAQLDVCLAILLGGPATASAADFRALSVAAGTVSQRLALRLSAGFNHVACDDETVGWPLTTVNGSIIHLTTVTGKDAR